MQHVSDSIPLRLTLFLTRGMSLAAWERMGTLERETLLYRRLAERGLQVGVVSYGDRRELAYAERLPGLHILCNRWDLPERLYTHAVPWLHAPWLQRSDVIKTNQMHGAQIALRAARLWRVPLLARMGYMWSHNLAREHGSHAPVVRAAHTVEQRAWSTARQIIVTAPWMAAYIRQHCPPAAPIAVIPNFVDVDHCTPAAIPDDEREWDVIAIGRLAPEKNLGALLDAVAPLGLRLLLVGDGPLREELRQHAAQRGVQVTWAGQVPHADLPGYLHRSRSYAIVSHYEGHPKALIEAMACGLPVLGTDVTGIADVIRHGDTGLLCAPTAEAIRATLNTLTTDAALRERLGQTARGFAVATYGLAQVVATEYALLKEMTRL